MHDIIDIFYVLIKQMKLVLPHELNQYPFDKFINIFQGFGKDLNKVIESCDNTLILIKNINKHIEGKKKENIEIFNSINSLLLKEEELIKKIPEYEKNSLNIFSSNKIDPDEKIFKESLNESNKQMCEYEIDSLRCEINEKFLKHQNICNEVNDMINKSSEIILPLNVFSHSIIQFSEDLRDLYSKIRNEINNIKTCNKENNLKKILMKLL